MKRYLIYRNGSNAANQPMTERQPVAICSGTDEQDACRKASRYVTLYANQRMDAVPQDKASDDDWNELCRETAAVKVGETWYEPEVDLWVESE